MAFVSFMSYLVFSSLWFPCPHKLLTQYTKLLMSWYDSKALDCLEKYIETRSMVVRMTACGFPGCSRSRRVRVQQAICTMRRKAMQTRKEVSLAIVFFLLQCALWCGVVWGTDMSKEE